MQREQLGVSALCAVMATSQPRHSYYFEKYEFPLGGRDIPPNQVTEGFHFNPCVLLLPYYGVLAVIVLIVFCQV